MTIKATFIHLSGYEETRELTTLYDEVMENIVEAIPGPLCWGGYIYEYTGNPRLFIRDQDEWPPVFRQVEERPIRKLPKGVI